MIFIEKDFKTELFN